MTLKVGGGAAWGDIKGQGWRLPQHSPPAPVLLPDLQADLWAFHPGLFPKLGVCGSAPGGKITLSLPTK